MPLLDRLRPEQRAELASPCARRSPTACLASNCQIEAGTCGRRACEYVRMRTGIPLL